MRLIVPALCLVFQVLTFVSAVKIHCLNVSVSKMPEKNDNFKVRHLFIYLLFLSTKSS
jgi:hypothetical protein